MSSLQYIFVHGLSGWGSYDSRYSKIPYWGMRGGDLITFLQKEGFDCYAASVAPTGSAWDRACELYAQIAGTRTDYGASHSQKYGHERFGRDFSDHPLLPEWNEETRLVLLGHSFGGATVRLFAELLAHGDAEEQTESDSPFFKGGMADRIHSVVTLASPMNGTTAYDLFSDPSFHPELTPVPWWSRGLSRLMSMGTRPRRDNRSAQDYADYDMHIDHALALNRRMQPLTSVYYYSVPCSFTAKQPDGTHRPKRGMEPLFVMRSCQIGAYTGKTASGMLVDETWRENDGLVNTVSATAPLGQPQVPLNRSHIEPGIWNVFPAVDGDHMYLQGGLSRRHSIRPFYLDLLTLITAQEHLKE